MSLRAEIQRCVFQAVEERILSMVNVTKENEKRKGKETYLCVTATTQQPVVVQLSLVRAKDDGYHRKETFMLRDVKMVDGINPRKTEFDIVFNDNRRRNFFASSIDGKDTFIRELYLLAHKYLPIQKPEFVNISIPLTESPKRVLVEDTVDTEHVHEEDYHPITAREEADFRRMLKHFNLELSQANVLNEKLTQMLSDLDNTNIETMMTSESAIADLIEDLEQCDDFMKFLGDRLSAYDAVLHQVEESVEVIEEKANLGQVERANLNKLLESLTEFSDLMAMVSPEHLEILRRPKFTDASAIGQCATAARKVQELLAVETPHNKLDAFTERIQVVRSAFGNFVDTFYSYVSALFDTLRDRVPLDGGPIMPKHSAVYRQLQGLSEIVDSIRLARPNVYIKLLENYQKQASELFGQDQENFYSYLEQRVGELKVQSALELHELESMMDTIAVETEIIVQAEQKFISKFFHIPSTDPTTGQVSDSMRATIRPIFDQLPQRFQKFGRFCASRNPHLVPPKLFVRLVSLLSKYSDPATYYSTVFGNFVVAMKRTLDEQMNARLDSYRTVKIAKRQRIGVLPSVEDFRSLILEYDDIFRNSERRSDLEKWAVKLCGAVVEGIDQAAASPNSKSPAAVVRFENFHKLHSYLQEMRKIEGLDEVRAQVKKRYQENMHIYVFDYLGKPLEKLHLFFEAVEYAIQSGVRPEEVGFQQQFSRSELKKAISAHSGREVKKGLESLYAKVEKHLGPDCPLLQVVWRDMQEEFIKQVQHYQRLTSQCYPNSRLSLEFGIEDVLGFFSEIAQQH